MNTVSILELKFRVGKVEELFSMRKGWTGREIDGRHRSQVMMQRGRVSVESSHDDPHQPRCSRLSPIPRTNIPTWSSRFRSSRVVCTILCLVGIAVRDGGWVLLMRTRITKLQFKSS